MISVTKQDFKTRYPNTNPHVVSIKFCIDSSISSVTLPFLCKTKNIIVRKKYRVKEKIYIV